VQDSHTSVFVEGHVVGGDRQVIGPGHRSVYSERDVLKLHTPVPMPEAWMLNLFVLTVRPGAPCVTDDSIAVSERGRRSGS
jgi:hypothetical protein